MMGAYPVVPDEEARGSFVLATAFRIRFSRWAVALTCQFPSAMFATRLVTETGPLPGITFATVSVTSKVSRLCGLPLTPIRRPVNRTFTSNASPTSGVSTQYVKPNACGRSSSTDLNDDETCSDTDPRRREPRSGERRPVVFELRSADAPVGRFGSAWLPASIRPAFEADGIAQYYDTLS